ncbi:ribbon-helix-helix domain-containing protein [Streptococcus agalactiae]|uniref:ribbon-helix-helix domain-containing protein n=1 Tax=Streptococcus agalactiae TaxID=1311 RepID=UPI002557A6FC|nr:ribbon-helix-helix domain-containing protein [Streptococcus agalactiae]MDK8747725.1 ribbon-helix-helix domain-containing protein [Streptococcus agalactiae]
MAENRGLKNRKTFSNAIDKELSDKFDELSKSTRIPKSKLLDQAIELLLEHYSNKKTKEK